MKRRLTSWGLASVTSPILGLAVATVFAAAAGPSGGYTLFGDSMLVHPGHNSPTAVQERSIGATYGGIDFNISAGTTLNDLNNLAADYMFTAASCGGGSPRFQLNVDGKNIFVYIGPPPNYTGCPMDLWQNTGNLVTPASLVDTSQLPGGTFYDTWASALAKYGSDPLTGIQLVTDAGLMFGTQTDLLDNVQINNTIYTFESKGSCKNGGWRQFTSSPGPFRNQGDCVSYFATNGRNQANP